MRIQWFPGHMTKALRMMEKEVKLVNLVVYVLDARAPFSCLNPKFTEVIGKKPIVYVLNKADLADDVMTRKWAKFLKKETTDVIMLNSISSGSGKKLIEKIKLLVKDKTDSNTKKGIVMPTRAMVLGVPNSGKSTLINNLCGKGKTVTGNKAGITRGKQWVRLEGNIEMLDSPGTLWPAFTNSIVAKHLAYIGSIRDEVLDLEDLAFYLLKDMKELSPKALEERYDFKIEDKEPLEIYEAICKRMGLLMRNGEFDYLRGAKAIIGDYRKGRYGKITLDDFNIMHWKEEEEEEE